VKKASTLNEWLAYLETLHPRAIAMGLDRVSAVYARLGVEIACPVIIVGGTNGKGSTCAMLESIYRAAGLRVGLFTSPHLISFRERIQVNRQLIPEVAVVRLVGELQPLLKQFPAGHHPTFFEVVTVMALKFFAEQKCDLVIWETGLGGRLDATNIVTPLAGVITNIQFDHQQWLGDTLEKIAAEKAGIIKPGVPVITAADEPEALAVIEKTARGKNAPLIKVAQASRLHAAAGTAALPLPGDHQRLNAALALAVVEALQSKIPASDSAIRTGLETVNWPGRLQLVTRPSGQIFLLDGAHNVAGAKVLRKALEKYFGGTRRILVLGVLQDKDWRHICETLAPLAARILTVPVSSERAADARELAAACRAVNSTAEIVACDSLREALGKIVSDDFVVVTGSLYLVGEALESFGLSPATSDERALNEWGACPQPLYTTG
jgi:dihydrofolate synthase/folylpolyglutamate synthase